MATDDAGRVLFAWTEGMTWNQRGRVAWQVYSGGEPLDAAHARREEAARWSLVTALARPGGFVVLY